MWRIFIYLGVGGKGGGVGFDSDFGIDLEFYVLSEVLLKKLNVNFWQTFQYWIFYMVHNNRMENKFVKYNNPSVN